MPYFTYQARTAKGARVRGTVEAETEDALVRQLRQDGYWITELAPAKPPAGVRTWRAIGPREFAVVFRQLQSALHAGLTVFNAISTLQVTSQNARLVGVLREITSGASSGQTLSSVLEKHPLVFPRHVVGLVRAGELGGCLDEMCGEVAASYEAEDALRRRLRWPLIYLKAILAASIVVPSFPLVFKFAAEYALANNITWFTLEHIFAGLKQWVAMFAMRYLPWVGAALGAWHLGRWYVKRPNLKPRRDRVVLAIPIWGAMVRDAALARLMRALRAGVRAGIPMRDALLAAADAAGNETIAAPIRRGAMELDQAGGSVSLVLGQSGQIPPTAMGMIMSAEQSGTLEDALGRLVGYFEADRETSGQKAAGAAWLTSLGLGAIIVLFAAAIGWVTFYQAQFDIVDEMFR
jgi:type II secretory pathway component PulF